MSDELLVKALSKKSKGKIGILEIQQIKDLRKAYGTHNTLMAIRYAKSANIYDVARMALQHCGVRKNLPIAIRKFIPDEESAKRLFAPEIFLIASRLEVATSFIEADIEKTTKSLISIWQSKTKNGEISAEAQIAIKAAVRKYGQSLTEHGIKYLPDQIQSESTRLEFFKGWLDLASRRDWQAIDDLFTEYGGLKGVEYVPMPCSLRLEKYFVAKAGREPTQEEIWSLWNLLHENSIDKVLHAMSCIPSSKFTVSEVEKIIIPTELWELYGLDRKEKDDEDEFEIEEEDQGENESLISFNEAHITEDNYYDYSTFDPNSLDSDEIYN
jgi:hypothetical protein